MIKAPSKIEEIKCKSCGKLFSFSIDGRFAFYLRKYCSNECRTVAYKKTDQKRAEQQKKRFSERKEQMKELSGKIERKCKNCKKKYLVYAGQIKARGSSYCSRKCMYERRGLELSISSLKKNVWDIFSRDIRLRDALRTTGTVEYVLCITCCERKRTIEVDAGHFYSRRNTELLFDRKNVHAQCKKCNMPPYSGEQYLYSKKIISLYGEEVLNDLTMRRSKERK